jgi:hypothetical protein
VSGIAAIALSIRPETASGSIPIMGAKIAMLEAAKKSPSLMGRRLAATSLMAIGLSLIAKVGKRSFRL